MTPEVQALVTELGKKIDALIEREVATRTAPIAAALQGLGGIQIQLVKVKAKQAPERPGRKPHVSSAEAGKRRTFPAAFRAKMVAEAAKPGAVLQRIESREGLSKGQLTKWRERAANGGTMPRRAAQGDKRRRHTPEFKAEVIEKASKLAPGDRQTYLAGLGLNKSLYSKWSRALRKPAA